MVFVATTPRTRYAQSFANADLVANVLTLAHNLGKRVVSVTIYNNLGAQVDVRPVLVDTTSCTIDLSLVAPITGTWEAMVTA
jgi:hypothetical protein